MSLLHIYCNRIDLDKEIEFADDQQITVEMIEAECLSRVRTMLGNGKLNVRATFYSQDPAYQLYSVGVVMPNGVEFLTMWARAYQPITFEPSYA